jgi:hypothetical protein
VCPYSAHSPLDVCDQPRDQAGRHAVNLQDLVHQLTNASPLEVTAWATIALAVVAAISIFTNIALARSASRSAAAAENATNLQASELDVIKRQLTLSENQFNAAQQAALPLLKAMVTNADPSIVAANLVHYHGSEPAVDVEVWIRTVSMAGAAWGLFLVRYAVVVPGTNVQFRALAASANDQSNMPFKEMLDETMGNGQALVAVAWKRLDGTSDHVGPELQLLPSREPPGVTG